MNSRPSLVDALADYLSVRRALGFKLRTAARLLGQFIDYLEERGLDTITIDAALTWASLPERASPQWQAIRLSVVRAFAAYLCCFDTSTQVPPAGLVRAGPCRATPYLYSPTEIESLVRAAASLRPALRAATYQSLIGLLATTGVRIGEAIAFDDEDYDADEALVVVRESKFGKTRLVPLHDSSARALDRYRQRRTELCRRPTSPALFVSSAGTRLLHSNVSLTFARLADEVGITRRSASCRPRVHDLRHTFAVATVLDAYRRDDDVAVVLPRLATLLGHTDPKHTFWYLSAAPELMAIAGERLDAHLQDRA